MDKKEVLEKLKKADVPNWDAGDVEDALIASIELIESELANSTELPISKPLQKNKDGLLPCPFCGRYPKIGSLGGDKQNWAIWCECQIPCAETGLSGETKEDIIKAWNKRI